MHFEKAPRTDDAPGHFAILPVGGNKGRNDDQPGVVQQVRHFGDAPDVFRAIRGGEAEVAAEAMADIVAIEDIGKPAALHQGLFQGEGEGGLA
ncbi:hypothetical protein D9M72_610320 [compost metagenome]